MGQKVWVEVKVGITTSTDVTSKRRLKAETYLCPTKTIDKQIAWAEGRIAALQKRLEDLREKRRQILDDA